VYKEWNPQVFVDEHQMGSDGPRMFIPPFADPVDPDVHPLIWREVNLIGSNMAFRLEQAGKTGLIYGYAFDAYWLGGTRNTGWWKNVTGMLLEIASARIATPIYVDPTELRGGTKGLVDYKATVNHPNPWKGGWWRLRDVMDYGRIASDALHELASNYRADLLRNLLTRARSAVALAKPREAFRIPKQQFDGRAQRRGEAVRERRLLDSARSAVLEVRGGDARAAALSRGAPAAGQGDSAAVRRRQLDAPAADGREGGAHDNARGDDDRHERDAGEEGSDRPRRQAREEAARCDVQAVAGLDG
jgi:hypothetical protein